MTNPNLRIKIARAKGLNVVGIANGWAPDGCWSVLPDDWPHGDCGRAPVYLRDDPMYQDEPSDAGRACGHDVLDLERVPDYPGDPREWARLWGEIESCPTVISFAAETTRRDDYGPPATTHIIRKVGHADIDRAEAPTLGRAVCEAWLAWHTARSGEGE